MARMDILLPNDHMRGKMKMMTKIRRRRTTRKIRSS
jgi:hypothetical protein